MTYLTIDEDPRRARQTVKQALVGTVIGSHPTYDFLRANDLDIPDDLFACLDAGCRDPIEIAPLIPDSFADKLAVAGTVDDCGERLASLYEAGIEQPLLTPIPRVPGGEVAMLKHVVDQIIPHLRGRTV
jgi:hypothetical protein